MIIKLKNKKEFFTPERCWITEILNTFNIGHISIAQARVEPKITTQLHSLDVDEIYYVLEGKGYVEINDTEKEQIEKGDIAFIKSGFSQRITNLSDTDDLIFLCICVPKFSPEGYNSLE